MERSIEIGEIMNILTLARSLYELTEEMSHLSTDRDDFLEEFEAIESKRSLVRKQIEDYKADHNIISWSDEVKSIFRQCVVLEKEMSVRFTLEKDQVVSMMSKVGNAKKARQIYGNESPMEYGAFIDRSN